MKDRATSLNELSTNLGKIAPLLEKIGVKDKTVKNIQSKILKTSDEEPDERIKHTINWLEKFTNSEIAYLSYAVHLHTPAEWEMLQHLGAVAMDQREFLILKDAKTKAREKWLSRPQFLATTKKKKKDGTTKT